MAKNKANGSNQESLVDGVQEVPEPSNDETFVEKKSEYLRYTFSDGELLDLSKQLARKLAEQEAAERELKEVTTQLKAAVTVQENEVMRLSHLVQNGYEYRTIECEVRFDTPRKGMKSVFRTDNGELVTEQKMSGEDLQGQLFRKQELVRAQTTAQ